MKENVLDVLMYLFENYFYEDSPEYEPDQASLQNNLLEAGFSQIEIDKAFDWLNDLSMYREKGELKALPTNSVRVYTDEEQIVLDQECRGFLVGLENAGVLDGTRREQIVDRVMALEGQDVDMEDLKWIVLMVLFNQPGQEEAFAWMENLVFDSYLDYEH